MPKRSKDAKALLDLQQTLSDLASWKLAAARHRRAELETSQRDLLDALGRCDNGSSGLAPLISRRLAGVTKELYAADRQLDIQTRATAAHGARSKMAARIHHRAALEERSKEERKELMDLVEQQLHRSESSSA